MIMDGINTIAGSIKLPVVLQFLLNSKNKVAYRVRYYHTLDQNEGTPVFRFGNFGDDSRFWFG